MKINRKGFLAGFGTFLAALTPWNKLRSTPEAQKNPDAPPEYNPHDHEWAMGIDIDKCIGCGRCVNGCKRENNIPLDKPYSRNWVERYQIMTDGTVKVDSPMGGQDGFPPLTRTPEHADIFFVPKLCNICENSACTQVCPVGATFFSPDGVTLVDSNYCIGCGYCVQACPFGTRFMNPDTHVAEKCNLCYHRITRGLLPACVEVCPTQARIFGDLKDHDSDISKFRRRGRLNVLRQHLGTEPRLMYAGMRREVH